MKELTDEDRLVSVPSKAKPKLSKSKGKVLDSTGKQIPIYKKKLVPVISRKVSFEFKRDRKMIRITKLWDVSITTIALTE